MANVLVNDLYLSDIADAIREKLDTEDTYKPSEMANAIESISGGGGSSLGTKSITANGTYNASSDSLDGYSQVTVNVPQGVTPAGTKQISITENGTTTEDVTNYANAEITVNVSGGGGEHNLPSGYTEYEYIEGTGTQYINTGYAPNSNTEVIAKFMRTSNQGYNVAEFGCREPGSGKAFASGIYWAWGSASDKTGSYNPDYCYGPDTVKVNSAGVYDLNNTKQVNFGTVTWTAISYPFFLMARNNSGTAERIGKIRFYYFAAYENNVKQIELIPAMRNSDSVLGMYDTVNNTFLTNAGSGSFVGGAL